MKILVTGTEGYLGSVVAPYLMRRGHEVTGLDTGYYKTGWLYNGTEITPRTMNKDLRRIRSEDLAGFDGIVHMAELSNDPAGQLAPHITHEINHRGSVRLATLAKEIGIRRFVYTSSCSVYGVAGDDFVNEESPVSPQTAYAECKTLVERDLKQMADGRFSPTFLRNATAFGASPRMRFDIVLNNLAGLAHTTKVIAMTSDGTPWRPLVHALDIAKAISCSLEAPVDAVHNQVFNVGATQTNYRVREIAEIVGQVFVGCKVSFGPPSPDNRSYRVSFDKISTKLPGFSCEWDARKGAQQLKTVFETIDLKAEDFLNRSYTRLKQLEHLLKTEQLDKDFFLAGAGVITVLLAGGLGTRLSEETEVKPKPMVEIGERPILWHIMKIYAHHGFKNFAVALGYKGESIKRYFLDYAFNNSDLELNLKDNQTQRRKVIAEDWTVHLRDTGGNTMTGGRLKRLRELVSDGTFMMTYGDGVSNVDLTKLVAFHKAHGKLATLTAVRPPARFGALEFSGDQITRFSEKPQAGEGWINGGFFVLEPKVLDFISGDEMPFERDPMERLAAEGQLMAYRHGDFWQPMDTLRDVRSLNALWSSGKAPWKVWKE